MVVISPDTFMKIKYFQTDVVVWYKAHTDLKLKKSAVLKM